MIPDICLRFPVSPCFSSPVPTDFQRQSKNSGFQLICRRCSATRQSDDEFDLRRARTGDFNEVTPPTGLTLVFRVLTRRHMTSTED